MEIMIVQIRNYSDPLSYLFISVDVCSLIILAMYI